MHTQFEQLMRLIRLEEERQRIHRLIAGPLAHDFRGAIGVVGLAAEVLKTSAQSAAIVKKLISSRVKLEALVQDLQLITTPDLFHPASLLKANLEVEGGAHATWDQTLEKVRTWFDSAHRGRSLVMEVAPTPLVGAHVLEPILRGLLDTLGRLSRVDSTISVSFSAPRQIHVKVQPLELSKDQRRTLLAFDTSELLPMDPYLLPFRLSLSAALLQKLGLELQLQIEEGAITASF